MTDVLGNTTNYASQQRDMARLERFRLQGTARRLLSLNDRIQDCVRKPTGGGNGNVAVKYRPSTKRAFYGGLMTCGQIWKCPVCAQKITERRRVLWQEALRNKTISTTEVEDSIIVKHIDFTNHLAMATFTISHNSDESLYDVITRLERAYQLMWSGKTAAQFRTTYKLVGSVRGLETTKGVNGWHPHIHCMFVTQGPTMRYEQIGILDVLSLRWSKCAVKAGGMATQYAGTKFAVADIGMIDYVDKFGIETHYAKRDSGAISEATKYPTKKAREGSAGLFGLLGMASDGDKHAAQDWQEAQRVMRGRRHIRTSNGLLRRLNASQELSDNNLAATEQHEVGDRTLALLTYKQWDVIDRRELRGQLLNVANTGDPLTVEDFLVEVGAR
jgi:hypothetical protein